MPSKLNCTITMKKMFLTLLLPCFITSSCISILAGTRRPVSLVDAPDDLKVRDLRSGKESKIQQVRLTGAGGAIQYCPGVKYKVKKGTVLEFSSGNLKQTVTMGVKPYIGALIFETFLTLGIGTIVDLSTGANKTPKPEFLDVPAILNNQTPRTTDQLKGYLLAHSKIIYGRPKQN